MSHKGRCFRDQRRTARRKSRQDAAVAEIKRRAPGIGIATRLGGKVPLRFEYLAAVDKQRLVEGFKLTQGRPTIRRRGVM
jgi:hypothetical protein